MTVSSGIRSWWNSVLDIGTYPGETDIHRGKRRVAMFAMGNIQRVPVWISRGGLVSMEVHTISTIHSPISG